MAKTSPMVKAGLIGGALALVTFGVIALSMFRAVEHTCEVCMSFGGRSACRSAAGATPEEARETAADNACAFLASGMTQSVQCTSTPPVSVSCDGP